MSVICKQTSTGSAAIPATPQTLRIKFNLGWNSSARSMDSLLASGRYDFVASEGSLGVVSGLTDTPSPVGYNSIKYGLYANKGKVSVVESGVVKTSLFSAPGSVLSVRRMGFSVDYLIDGVSVYASKVPSVGVLVASAFLYSAGDIVS